MTASIRISLLIVLLCTASAHRPGSAQTWDLQRVLNRGCSEYVTEDGIWGPQTNSAYVRGRERALFLPGVHPPAAAEIRAFIEGMWQRKIALMLLHRLGHMQRWNDPCAGQVLTDSLRQVSETLDIRPPLGLNNADIERLYRWYIDHSPEGSLASILRENGLVFGNVEIFIQAFKLDGEINLYARHSGSDSPYVLLGNFPITASSGTPGPKNHQGDWQVPEGCYRLVFQNRWSTFYLSYKIDYPNEADLRRRPSWGIGGRPGGDIFLHGKQVTIGCIPVGNPAIEEIGLLLNRNWRDDSYGRIHIFPCRFGEEENEHHLAYYRSQKSRLGTFWDSLRPVFRYFAENRLIPPIDIDPDTGDYIVRAE